MQIVSMEELEAMYGQSGTRFDLKDIGVNDAMIRDIMMNEVADIVWDILQKHISEDIYAAYSPHTTYYGRNPPVGWIGVGQEGYYRYARRWSLYENKVSKMLGDTLFVTSDAEPNMSVMGSGWTHNNTGGFLQMIGTNPGSAWKGRFPRPAIQNAQDEIDNSPYAAKALEIAFARGLSRYSK